VRDVARAHVLALKLPPSETPKRFIVSTGTFTWTEAAELLAEKRPELKERLPVAGRKPTLGPVARLDTSKTESVLGMKNYVKWQDTVLDTVDDLLRVEKELSGQPGRMCGARDQRRGREEPRVLRLRLGLVDAVRQSHVVVLLRVYVCMGPYTIKTSEVLSISWMSRR